MLNAPSHGRVVSCRDGLGGKCVFDCDDGHILIRGSSVRTCLHTGFWDGVETVCQGRYFVQILTPRDYDVLKNEAYVSWGSFCLR